MKSLKLQLLISRGFAFGIIGTFSTIWMFSFDFKEFMRQFGMENQKPFAAEDKITLLSTKEDVNRRIRMLAYAKYLENPRK